jgi:hypothetical protein
LNVLTQKYITNLRRSSFGCIIDRWTLAETEVYREPIGTAGMTGGHRGVPRAGESVGGIERLNRHLGAMQRVLDGWFNRCPPSPSRRS